MNRLCLIGLAGSLGALWAADGGLGDALGAAGVAGFVPAMALLGSSARATPGLVRPLARCAVTFAAVAALVALLALLVPGHSTFTASFDVAFTAALGLAIAIGVAGALIDLAPAARRDGLLVSLGLAVTVPRRNGGPVA